MECLLTLFMALLLLLLLLKMPIFDHFDDILIAKKGRSSCNDDVLM